MPLTFIIPNFEFIGRLSSFLNIDNVEDPADRTKIFCLMLPEPGEFFRKFAPRGRKLGRLSQVFERGKLIGIEELSEREPDTEIACSQKQGGLDIMNAFEFKAYTKTPRHALHNPR